MFNTLFSSFCYLNHKALLFINNFLLFCYHNSSKGFKLLVDFIVLKFEYYVLAISTKFKRIVHTTYLKDKWVQWRIYLTLISVVKTPKLVWVLSYEYLPHCDFFKGPHWTYLKKKLPWMVLVTTKYKIISVVCIVDIQNISK